MVDLFRSVFGLKPSGYWDKMYERSAFGFDFQCFHGYIEVEPSQVGVT